MRSWFDIKGMKKKTWSTFRLTDWHEPDVDEGDIIRSSCYIHNLIKYEIIRGILVTVKDRL